MRNQSAKSDLVWVGRRIRACVDASIIVELPQMMTAKPTEEAITRFADMFSAMGSGPRLRIMRVLLSAHPDGMVVSDIGSDLGIPASTLSISKS